MEEKKNLSGREKFAYGIGAVGKDMVYMLSASYVLYYFQDIMGVSAWVMGIILLIARVFDAFNDPIMGVLVAKTRTKWGKFRPWLFIGTLTNAIILFFMFAAPPSLDGPGLVAYAAVFYIIWGVTYTMMDIPYWSMVPAFTEGGKERESVSAMARSCAGVGSAIITIVTVIAVSIIGKICINNGAGETTLNYTGNDTAIVLEIDEVTNNDDTESATGNKVIYTSANTELSLELIANHRELMDAIKFDEKNLSYTINLGDASLTESNSKIIFEMASSDAKEATITMSVDAKEFVKVSSELNKIDIKLISKNEIERAGFKYFALVVAVLFFVFILITCINLKEKSTVEMKSATVGEMFKALIRNDQAMTVVVAIVLINTSIYITSNLVIYFFKYDFGGSNWNGAYTLFNTFGGAVQILSMMILFPLLRKKFSTIKVFYISFISAIVGYAALFLLMFTSMSNVIVLFIPAFFIFAANGMLSVLTTIFLANTVDYGEVKNNRRDESVIFSMQTFVVKLASGIAALVASVCLALSHLNKDTSDAVVETAKNSVVGLRLTMTVLPIAGLLVAVFYFRKKFILTEEKVAEISAQVKEMHKGANE